MRINITGFGGANKALHPKLLADTVGAQSLNQKPGRGDFQPWHDPLTVATVPASRSTIYRMGRDTRSDASYWLTWTTRVHVMRGYNGEDTTERTYFTGSGAPKWIDNTFALAGGGPYPTATRTLGVPAPATALTAASNANGSSENTESRYYTYTYVNTKGDESAPGPVSAELVCKTDDTAALSSMAAAPGGYDIDRIRVYVTVTGQTGETEFFFLREIASSGSTTTDDLRARGEVLPTSGWITPPSDLSCLTPMWNGMAAGISGMGVRVCPPYAVYAWPIANEFLPPDVMPVGLGVWRQNLLVLTTGKPSVLTGTSPESLDLSPVPGQACSAEASIVSFDHGVVYACEDGLVYHGDGGQRLITAGLLTRDDWQAMNPTGMVAGQYEGAYLCFYTDQSGTRRGFLIDPVNPQGVYFLETGYSACWFDALQDALFVLSGTSVKKWDAGAALMTATFRSKQFVVPPSNFNWMAVVADAYPVTVRVDAGPFTSGQVAAIVAAVPSLTASGTNVRYSVAVASREPVRLPSGFLATDWSVQVETQNPVQRVVVATTAGETS